MLAANIALTVLFCVTVALVALLLVRSIFDWVRLFKPDWTPAFWLKPVERVAHVVTTPPLKLTRKAVPPIAVKAMRFDTAFMVLIFGLSLIAMTLRTMGYVLV